MNTPVTTLLIFLLVALSLAAVVVLALAAATVGMDGVANVYYRAFFELTTSQGNTSSSLR